MANFNSVERCKHDEKFHVTRRKLKRNKSCQFFETDNKSSSKFQFPQQKVPSIENLINYAKTRCIVKLWFSPTLGNKIKVQRLTVRELANLFLKETQSDG